MWMSCGSAIARPSSLPPQGGVYCMRKRAVMFVTTFEYSVSYAWNVHLWLFSVVDTLSFDPCGRKAVLKLR